MPPATPPDLAQLLDEVVGAAARTPFYRSVLNGRPRIASLDDFRALPVTPIGVFRRQRLADVVSDAGRVQWIAGTLRGQKGDDVAVAEEASDSGFRYNRFGETLHEAMPEPAPRTCAVLTAPERRYYAAEASTALAYMGIPAHVFIDFGTRRTYERLQQADPDLLVLMSDTVDESALPTGVALCVTFRCAHRLSRLRQLDLYVVDGLGMLARSTDLRRWVLYNGDYFFERSETGRLVVTALRNRTQPVLRLETEDTVTRLGETDMELGSLSMLE